MTALTVFKYALALAAAYALIPVLICLGLGALLLAVVFVERFFR
jgi:hypothetical protein